MGFSFVEGFSVKLTKQSTDATQEEVLNLRVARMSSIISNLLVDDNVKLFYDYTNNIFTTVKMNNRLMAQEEEVDEEEESEEEHDDSTYGFPIHEEKHQFITDFDVVEEEEELGNNLDEDDLVFSHDKNEQSDQKKDGTNNRQTSAAPASIIVNPFGVSSNAYSQSQPNWTNTSPPGNLMSQLLSKPPPQQQQYGSFFSGNTGHFFAPPQDGTQESGAMFPTAPFPNAPWSPSSGPQQGYPYHHHSSAPFSQGSNNGRVIEHPFQVTNNNGNQGYSQFGANPQVANNSGVQVIEAPFLPWRAQTYYPQQQQQQQQQQQAKQNGGYIP